MNEKDKLLFANANAYRIHQDNLRWTLASGYVIFLYGSVSFLRENIGNSLFFFVLSAVFFFAGTAYLFILAIENWYYNYYALYVKECETRISKSEELRSLNAFGEEHSKEITPLHPSFSFFLSIAALGNCCYILMVLNKTIYDTTWYRILIKVGSCLIFTFLYFFLFYILFRKWNQWVYPFIKKFSNVQNW